MPLSSPARTLIVIFGAAVRPDGQPSPSLVRRIAYGLDAARACPEADLLCSGAARGPTRSEASVMVEQLLAAGLASHRLRLDERSRDTLQTALATRRVAQEGGYRRCIACSDAYHLPRILILLRMLGIPSRAGAMASGHGRPDLAHAAYMSLREAVAIPYDVAIVAARRRRLLERTA